MKYVVSALFLAASALWSSQTLAESNKPAVVLELFTSQGCYSCPPADKLLGAMAKEDGIVALGYHVTYWDRLGWPDPYGTQWGTERQYDYGLKWGTSRVYTPQIIVDGLQDEVGSRERSVRRLVAEARDIPKPASPDLSWRDGALRIDMPDAPDAAGAEIWLIRFDEQRQTDILRGENGGKRLVYHNIVRKRYSLGRFDGRAQLMEASVPPGDTDWGVAVLVQDDGPGRIWGAATLAAE